MHALICLLVTTSLLKAPHLASLQSVEWNGTIQGEVLYDGFPVPGTVVTINSACDGAPRQAVTDVAGAFSFKGLPSHCTYAISASFDGLLLKRRQHTRVTISGSTPQLVSLEMVEDPAMVDRELTDGGPQAEPAVFWIGGQTRLPGTHGNAFNAITLAPGLSGGPK